jgi:hypothetical protein
MSMPKAAMNEHSRLIASKHDIGVPRKVAGMEPISKARSEQCPADSEFRASVAPAHLGHVAASLVEGKMIGALCH